MIIKEELLFTVDEFNNPINPKPRKMVHMNGLWHRTSHIWIVNKKKQVLCQKRSLLKDMNPGKWESFFGGHLAPKQNYIDGALIELNEELGIEVAKEDLHFLLINKSNSDKEFQGVFYIEWNGNINDLTLEKEEIDQVKWFDAGELKQRLSKKGNNWTNWGYEKKMLKNITEN